MYGNEEQIIYYLISRTLTQPNVNFRSTYQTLCQPRQPKLNVTQDEEEIRSYAHAQNGW